MEQVQESIITINKIKYYVIHMLLLILSTLLHSTGGTSSSAVSSSTSESDNECLLIKKCSWCSRYSIILIRIGTRMILVFLINYETFYLVLVLLKTVPIQLHQLTIALSVPFISIHSKHSLWIVHQQPRFEYKLHTVIVVKEAWGNSIV